VKGFKILDNGTAEGALVDNDYLMYCAEELEVDEVIVPDIENDCDMTLMLARDFAKHAKSHREFAYVGVVQGHTVAELTKCLYGLLSLGYFSTLALPRNMQKISKTERYIFASNMELFGCSLPLHCLGSGSWLREVALLSEVPQVRGIDTSMPINEAVFGIDIATSTDHFPRHKQYFEADLPFEMEYRAMENVRTFLGWAAYAPPS
jgi:hypothetical protein